MQRKDVERLIDELAEADKPLVRGTIPFTETRRRIRDAAAALRALLAERDAAFAAGQESMRERAAEKCRWHSDRLVETIRDLPIKPRP